MTSRRLGRAGARDLAAYPSLAAALGALARSPYGHDVRGDQDLPRAQRAVVESLLWNARVLAGWVPREGVTMLRVLLGSLEIANVEDHLVTLGGGTAPTPYRLGGLATAWPRLREATSTAQLRQVLAASPWGDPGGESPREIGLTMRACLADRTMAAVPQAAGWASGAAALLVAREALLHARPLPDRALVSAARAIGGRAAAAGSLAELRAALPASARWALEGVQQPLDLWQAEARWWNTVEREAWQLTRSAGATAAVPIGVLALLAVDAWRVRAALERVGHAEYPAEVADALA
jgi:hypothetical protein